MKFSKRPRDWAAVSAVLANVGEDPYQGARQQQAIVSRTDAPTAMGLTSVCRFFASR